jgi:HJR/Mrr/RecB family endonuclease
LRGDARGAGGVVYLIFGVSKGVHVVRSYAYGSRAYGDNPVGLSATFNLDEQTGSKSIIQIASLVDRALIERLQQYPDDLRVIDRHRFEQLIAELFSGFGYEVELTQRTRDGGKDIIAIKRSEIDLRFLIECKRPDPGNPVGIKTVRELYGVKVDDGASKAILATTTYFSPDAKIFSEKHRWELELKDFEAINGWIAKYLGSK